MKLTILKATAAVSLLTLSGMALAANGCCGDLAACCLELLSCCF